MGPLKFGLQPLNSTGTYTLFTYDAQKYLQELPKYTQCKPVRADARGQRVGSVLQWAYIAPRICQPQRE